MQNIVISVLMPVYNAGDFLHDSIPSVINQTFKDYEFLILDDGSTDYSRSIVKQYDDPRIKLIELNNDFIATLNYGLKVAKGKYIARMDADDIMLPERLKEQYNFMENNPEINLCGSLFRSFGESDSEYKLLCDSIELYKHMILYNPIAHPTVMMRTSVIRKNQLKYKQEYKYAEDYKLWLDFLKYGRIANINKVLLLYRISPNQISQQKRDRQKLITRKIQTETIEQILGELNPSIRTEAENINLQLVKLVKSSAISFNSYIKCLYLIINNLIHI